MVLGSLFEPLQQPVLHKGPVGRGRRVQGYGGVRAALGDGGVRHIQRHGQVRVDGMGRDGRALGTDLLLGGGDEIDVADVAHLLQPLGRLQQAGHAGAVVHGLGGAAVVEKRRGGAAQRDEVAHAHLFAHALHRQPQVDEEVLALVVVLSIRGAEQMRRGGAHHAQQLHRAVLAARGMHDDGGGRQDARVHAAHLAHAQRAVGQDV